jgi:hypothetical protein
MAELWPAFSLETLDGLGVLSSERVREQAGAPQALSYADIARLFTLMSAERWVNANARDRSEAKVRRVSDFIQNREPVAGAKA